MSVMAKRKKQRPKEAQRKQTFASAYQQYQKIAQDEARRVPWPRLMQFVEDSLRWEEFNLWIRAVVNAASGVPPAALTTARIQRLNSSHRSESSTNCISRGHGTRRASSCAIF